MVPYLRAANVEDGTLNLDDVKSMNFVPSEQERFGLRPGDVLVTEGSGSLGSVGASAVFLGELPPPLCFQNTLLRLRPRAGTDGRFLGWWCRYAFADGLFSSIATGANIHHVSAERLRSLPVDLPAGQAQRAIADFLDAETARIDALIGKKQQLRALVGERLHTALIRRLDADHQIELRCVADLLPGYMFESEVFTDDSARARLLRGINVGVGEISWDQVVYLDPRGWAPSRYRLATGDVVIGMDRPFISGGTRVAVVGEADAGSLLVQRVCRVRCSPRTHPVIVAAAVSSPLFKAQVESDLTGVSVPHVSDEQIGRVRVPLLSARQTEALAADIRRVRAVADETSVSLGRQISLLQERRRALITAAVTGQVEIPDVAA